LIQQLLIAYGEEELANDTDLIESMLPGSDDPSFRYLTPKVFAKALTEDVRLLNVQHEARCSTTMEDIGIAAINVKGSLDQPMDGASDGKVARIATRPLRWKRYAGRAIDATAGTYRSKMLVIFLYVTGKQNYIRKHVHSFICFGH
jgi:hypothetical protein